MGFAYQRLAAHFGNGRALRGLERPELLVLLLNQSVRRHDNRFGTRRAGSDPRADLFGLGRGGEFPLPVSLASLSGGI